MAAFSPLLDMLAEVPDPRRAEGKLYQLPHVLLFSILAIVTGCNSYRGIVTFIEVHRRKLNTAFGLKWRRAPAHTAIRYILQGLDPTAVETVFRRHACAAQANIALIVQVKDNQPTLHQCSHEIAATTAPLGSAHSRNKGRNRDERRTVTVFDPAERLADTDWHPHVAAIIRVERNVFTRNAATGLLSLSTQTAFYVSNIALTAARAAEAIRAHWRIETTFHYSRDVTFGEDGSRIRTNPGVFARLRSFNILKANRTNTLNQDRCRAALAGLNHLLSITRIPER